MKPYRDKEKTKNSRLNNNYNNKNLRTLVDDSHQKVAERQRNTLEIAVTWIL